MRIFSVEASVCLMCDNPHCVKTRPTICLWPEFHCLPVRFIVCNSQWRDNRLVAEHCKLLSLPIFTFKSAYTSSAQSPQEPHSGEKSNECDCETLFKLNECNQCDFLFSEASNLRKHLKTHSGEKSNKCDFETLGKSNKCNQCDFSFSEASNLYQITGLRNPLEPWSRAARKWRENEEMKRKWRENEEIERD